MSASKTFRLTQRLDPSDPAIDPMWSPALLAVRLKAKQIDEAKALTDALMHECDELVQEAVDDGERYRDIAKAANRSWPWVQTALRRLGVDGPRVRLITAARAAASRSDGDEPTLGSLDELS